MFNMMANDGGYGKKTQTQKRVSSQTEIKLGGCIC